METEEPASTQDQPTDQDVESWRSMVARGVLDPALHDVAGELFGQMNFTLLVLHAHLLIEKALNRHLAKAGVPEILLGAEGIEFSKKAKAFMQLRGRRATGSNLLLVLNTLRNNVAHDFWDDEACVRDAFSRFLSAKKYRPLLDQTASTPIDSVKLLFFVLSRAVDLAVLKDDTPQASAGNDA